MFLFFFIQKKKQRKKYLPEVFRNEKENHHTVLYQLKKNIPKCETHKTQPHKMRNGQ